jgi:hypothetical protein
MSAEIFVGTYQYTRGDVRKRKEGAMKTEFESEDKNEKSNLMIYSGQTII